MLRQGNFHFSPGKGVLKKKRSGGKRGIVISPIEDRIVRRSLLLTLQGVKEVAAALQTPTSFGGIEGRTVAAALEKARSEISRGAQYYLRSDIRDFFRYIPRQSVLSRLEELLGDGCLKEILDEATATELSNLSAIRADQDLFPSEIEGVAQGSCLSPLIANIALFDFDRLLNGRGIVTLRFIDDFLILGRSHRAVKLAFEEGERILQSLNPNLSAHSPWEATDKAKCGRTVAGVDFLGCRISGGLIAPSSEARRRFLLKVRRDLAETLAALNRSSGSISRSQGLARSLARIGNQIEGWTKQYSFCDDRRPFATLRGEIEGELRDFAKRAGLRVVRAAEREDSETVLSLLGIPRIPV